MQSTTKPWSNKLQPKIKPDFDIIGFYVAYG